MPKRTTKKPEADVIVPPPISSVAEADAIIDAVNAAPDPARVKAFREQYRDVFCPVCGTIRATDVCSVDGHRFEADR